MAQESRLQTKILNDLRSMGKHCVAFKIMKCSENGVPDIFFTTKKTGPILIETKAPKGEPSAKQGNMIQQLNDCGCRTFHCWSWQDWIIIKEDINFYG